MTSEAGPLQVIRDGSDTPELAPAWSGCRSLLAGDAGRSLTDHTLNRLQAGSYKGENESRAWSVGVGLGKCPGACSGDGLPFCIASLSLPSSHRHGGLWLRAERRVVGQLAAGWALCPTINRG